MFNWFGSKSLHKYKKSLEAYTGQPVVDSNTQDNIPEPYYQVGVTEDSDYITLTIGSSRLIMDNKEVDDLISLLETAKDCNLKPAKKVQNGK